MRDLTFRPMPWMADAVCTQVSPDLFFPNTSGGRYRQQVEDAKTVCRGCPVIDTCLDHALDLHPVEGIWAATTETERRQLITRQQRTRA